MPTANPFMTRPLHRSATKLLAASALVVATLAGCAHPEGSAGDGPLNVALNTSSWARANQWPTPTGSATWRHQGIGNRPVSQYRAANHQGRPALQGHSENGDSLVRFPLIVPGPELGILRFSWFINALNPLSDLADRHLDDAVARVILQFDGDRSRFSPRDHLMSEMVQLATGEPLPYATLMYVWDNRYPAGTVIPHARSARIKTLVIESGPQRLGHWVDFERDVAADYETTFGEKPVQVHGIALMTDSNNTRHASTAWYGPLTWIPASR